MALFPKQGISSDNSSRNKVRLSDGRRLNTAPCGIRTK